MKRIILMASTLMLSACGTSGVTNAELLNQEIPKNYSRIIVTRDNSLRYMAGGADVSLNGEKIASLATKASVIKDTPSGKNTLMVRAPADFGDYSISFETKPHRTYRFVVSPNENKSLLPGMLFGAIGETVQSINAHTSNNSGYFQIEPETNKDQTETP